MAAPAAAAAGAKAAGISAGIQSGGGIISSIITGGINRRRERRSEHYANTAIQRQVNDMKAAGINPLMATGSLGAGMPQQQPFSANIETDPKYIEGRKESLEEKIGEATRAKTMADANLSNTREKRESDLILNDIKARELLAKQIVSEESRNKINTAQAKLLEAQSKREIAHSKIYETKFGKEYLPWIEKTLQLILGGANSARGVMNLLPRGGK
jgi:hypothetical protein